MEPAGDVGDGDHRRAALWPARRPRRRRPCRSPGRRSAARRGPSRAAGRHARSTITTPAPVASGRKTEPPIEIGLPVTISGTAWPTCIEYVSIIQAIVCSSVAMSGAGMSSCGPMIGSSSAVKRRVTAWSSPLRHRARVAADPALGAAVGQPQQRALPGHPHRERGALAERDVRGRSGYRPWSARGRSSAGRGSPGRPTRRPSSSWTGTATISDALGKPQSLGDRVAMSAWASACSNWASAVWKSGVLPLERLVLRNLLQTRHGERSVSVPDR